MWATCSGAPISGRQLADVLTAHAPRQGPAPQDPLLAAVANWRPVWVRGLCPAPPKVHAQRHRGFLPSDAERYLKVHAPRRPRLWPVAPRGFVPSPAKALAPVPTIANWQPVLHAQKTAGGVVFLSCDLLARSLAAAPPPAARVRTGAGADGEVCLHKSSQGSG